VGLGGNGPRGSASSVRDTMKARADPVLDGIAFGIAR
jgi:hypothetical protein